MLQIKGPIIEPCGIPEVGLSSISFPLQDSGPIILLVHQVLIRYKYLLAKGIF